jgi:hypothetical protein
MHLQLFFACNKCISKDIVVASSFAHSGVGCGYVAVGLWRVKIV